MHVRVAANDFHHPAVSEPFTYRGRRTALIDLSCSLSNETAPIEPLPHKIEYVDHAQGAATSTQLGVPPALWTDGLAWAVERVTLSTHSGTHVDAPYHYGPDSGGQPARTIDQVPLQWCIGDGVLLDFSDKKAREGITDEDVRKAVAKIDYELKPLDIVLVRTDASKNFDRPGYELSHPGLRRSATSYLVEHGVRVIGIDAWGLDRPFDVMVEEASAGDREQLWETHFYGRDYEYLQIEKLCNLDLIPRPYGFQVIALPVKIAAASAGWARVVALLDVP